MQTKYVNIKNKKSTFHYYLIEKYVAGIMLKGTEIKSIRMNKASIVDSFCEFNKLGELFVINMHIDKYLYGNQYNHEPKAKRKLLLNKRELRKLKKGIKNIGLTIIPTRLFTDGKGWAKLEIALSKGKKLYDKRETLKNNENKRRLDRIKKNYIK